MTKQLKDPQKEIDTVTMEKKNFDSLQSKSISAFSSAVTPPLTKAFPEKYLLKMAQGKLGLQKDIATLTFLHGQLQATANYLHHYWINKKISMKFMFQ